MQGIICLIISENRFISCNSDSFSWFIYHPPNSSYVSMFNLVPFSRNFWAHWCLALPSSVCLSSPGMLWPRNLCLWALLWLVHIHLTLSKSASKWSEQGWEHVLETELPPLLAVGYLSVVNQLVLPPCVALLSLLLLKGEEGNRLSTSPLSSVA